MPPRRARERSLQYGKRGEGTHVAKSTAAEKEWQKQVLGMARSHRWMVWHFHDSRREVVDDAGHKSIIGDNDAKGFPDLVLAHPQFGLAFIELKTDQTASKASDDQIRSLGALAEAAAAVALGEMLPPGGGRICVHLWRPRDIATVVLPVLEGRAGLEGIPRFYGWEAA